MELWVNGGLLNIDSSPPYSVLFDTRNVPDGSATVKYNANDPSRGNDHRFFAELTRAVFAD